MRTYHANSFRSRSWRKDQTSIDASPRSFEECFAPISYTLWFTRNSGALWILFKNVNASKASFKAFDPSHVILGRYSMIVTQHQLFRGSPNTQYEVISRLLDALELIITKLRLQDKLNWSGCLDSRYQEQIVSSQTNNFVGNFNIHAKNNHSDPDFS